MPPDGNEGRIETLIRTKNTLGLGQNSDKTTLSNYPKIDNKHFDARLFKVCKTFMRRFDSDPRLQSF